MTDRPRHEPQFSVLPGIAAIALLLSCMGRWPYAFYTFMRVVVCGGSAYMAWEANRQSKSGWVWALGATAVVFNPLFPVRMARADWQFIDIGAAILLGSAVLVLRRAP